MTLFAIVFGIGLGGEYMVIPLMAAELFGTRVLGRAMGIVLAADGVAEATAPVLVGRLHDVSGSYVTGFSVLIGFALVGAVAIAMLPRRKVARRDAGRGPRARLTRQLSVTVTSRFAVVITLTHIDAYEPCQATASASS